MSQRKKFYYLTGGSLEEFTGKIKFSDFVREGSDYILSVSDVQSKKEIYIKMSDQAITNITGTSEPKPKIFQLKYYKNGQKYMNIYYEFLHTEKHIPMNGLNGNGLSSNKHMSNPRCPYYPNCPNPDCPNCPNFLNLSNQQNMQNQQNLQNIPHPTNANTLNLLLNNEQYQLRKHKHQLRHRNNPHRQNQSNNLMNTKFIQDHKTKFITKIINLTEVDVLVLKTTIKKVIKSPIFKQIFEYTDLKENLEHLFY